MKYILKLIKWDKFQHFAISLLLVIGFNLIIGWWAVLIAFLLGLAKEIKDDYRMWNHQLVINYTTWDKFYSIFNWKDMLANLIGIGLGIVLILIGV